MYRAVHIRLFLPSAFSRSHHTCFTGRLCKGCVTAELLQPEELVSGIICQVAAEPELAELLSSFVYTNAGARPGDQGTKASYEQQSS